MSLIINIENYEAFYLDYLEGNLNETETNCFLKFLEENPHLKIENETLPSMIIEDNEQLSINIKHSLKVFDATEVISNQNFEQFIIAFYENELKNEKQLELHQFIANNLNVKPVFDLYSRTYLPKESIIYPFKNQLRKTKVIPLLTKYLAVAAVLTFLVLTYKGLNKSDISNTNSLKIAKQDSPKTNKKVIESSTEIIETDIKTKQDIENKIVKSSNHNTEFYEKSRLIKKSDVINELKVKKVDKFHFENGGFNEIVSGQFSIQEIKSESIGLANIELNASYLPKEEMYSPIYLLSKKIKEKYDEDVIFRTAKATKTRQGGFYIKIGNFEITRKRKPIINELAFH
jgi:hypothetical protein